MKNWKIALAFAGALAFSSPVAAQHHGGHSGGHSGGHGGHSGGHSGGHYGGHHAGHSGHHGHAEHGGRRHWHGGRWWWYGGPYGPWCDPVLWATTGFCYY